MADYKIRQIFEHSYDDFSAQGHFPSDVQHKAAHAILNCKSGKLGCNFSQCTDCGHMEIHNNSCRNRNCPNCQAVLKEKEWESPKIFQKLFYPHGSAAG